MYNSLTKEDSKVTGPVMATTGCCTSEKRISQIEKEENISSHSNSVQTSSCKRRKESSNDQSHLQTIPCELKRHVSESKKKHKIVESSNIYLDNFEGTKQIVELVQTHRIQMKSTKDDKNGFKFQFDDKKPVRQSILRTPLPHTEKLKSTIAVSSINKKS